MTTFSSSHRTATPRVLHPLAAVTHSAGGLASILSLWILRQRGRADLRQLDDHMLRDIGLDWAEAKAEAQKPFWRA